jgi:hypothetical protein
MKQVRVMDFGLARIEGQSRLTQDGLVAGTAAYSGPGAGVWASRVTTGL